MDSDQLEGWKLLVTASTCENLWFDSVDKTVILDFMVFEFGSKEELLAAVVAVACVRSLFDRVGEDVLL